jgi:hypothetical protein
MLIEISLRFYVETVREGFNSFNLLTRIWLKTWDDQVNSQLFALASHKCESIEHLSLTVRSFLMQDILSVITEVGGVILRLD